MAFLPFSFTLSCHFVPLLPEIPYIALDPCSLALVVSSVWNESFFSLLPSSACFFHFCFLKSQFIGQLFHEAFPDPPVQVPPNFLSSCGNYFFSWWHVQCPDTILNTLLCLHTRRRTPWSKLCPSHWHPTGQVGGSWRKFVDGNEILIWRWWHLLLWVRYQLTFIDDKHLIF